MFTTTENPATVEDRLTVNLAGVCALLAMAAEIAAIGLMVLTGVILLRWQPAR